MSNVKRIQFDATINAPVAKVWDFMIGQNTYPRWAAAFTEGSYYDGSWSEGSRIKFLAPSGDGMLAEIAESRLHEFISIRHIGFIFNGAEDTESESVRSWAPAYENYTFSAVDGGTKVVVDQDVLADFEQFLVDAWPKALDSLRQHCEGEGESPA